MRFRQPHLRTPGRVSKRSQAPAADLLSGRWLVLPQSRLVSTDGLLITLLLFMPAAATRFPSWAFHPGTRRVRTGEHDSSCAKLFATQGPSRRNNHPVPPSPDTGDLLCTHLAQARS